MKIMAKTSFAGLNFTASAGQILDLPEDTAKDLIRAKFAEAVENEDKRSNAGNDTKPVKGKRSSTKR